MTADVGGDFPKAPRQPVHSHMPRQYLSYGHARILGGIVDSAMIVATAIGVYGNTALGF